MVPYLIETDGANAGATYPLGPRTLVGRGEDSDIQLLEGDVSRRHALILKGSDGVYRIGDLASTNGTYVCGYRISGCRLKVGETIRVGASRFLFLEAASINEILDGLTLDDLKLVSGPADGGTERVPVALSLLLARSKKSHVEEASACRLAPRPARAITVKINEGPGWWHEADSDSPEVLIEAARSTALARAPN